MNEEILRVLKSIDSKLTTKGDFDSSDLIDVENKLDDISTEITEIKDLLRDVLEKLGEA